MSATKRILPLFDRVLVQRTKAAERTTTGLFIPEKAQEILNEAIVVEVGPGIKKDGVLNPVALKKGDRILLPPFGGNSIKMGQEEFLIFKDTEVLAKLSE